MFTALLIGLLQATAATQAVPPPVERIADVRVDADADGEPDRLGDTVTVAGRASTGSATLNRDYGFLFVQDASGGIALFSFDPRRDVATGDSVIATGVVHQYAGLSQLRLLSLRVVPGPRRLPVPLVLEDPFHDLERYEGRLVRVRGRIKGSDDTDDGSFVLIGAESSLEGLNVFVSRAHASPPDLAQLHVGDEVVLTGILAQHDVEPPYDTLYQIFPRSQDDVTVTGLSHVRAEAVLLWGGGLLLLALLWLVLLRVQVRRRTAELGATARRFQALIENAYEMITVLDATGRVTYTSRGLERILGWTADERIGRSGFEIVHPDDIGALRRMFGEVVAEPRAGRTMEYRVRHRDGSWRTLSSVAHNLLDDPATAGIVVNSRDVTERQVLESQLLQSKKLEAIGRVAGGIAHDFNNLMTVVRGHTALLLSEPHEDESVVDGLSEIEQAAERASALTSQLLAFSRKQVLRPRVVDLTEVLGRMQNLLSRLIGEDISMEFRVAEDLGRVSADPTQLEQVLMNLAVNARDAMPNGGTLGFALDNATIRESDARGHRYNVIPGEYVAITVRDSGSGIAPDVLEHIFDPFFTTKQEGEGTGLGLATVYGIVKQSGGYIWVESDETGTTFRIYLPRTDRAAESVPERIAPSSSVAHTTGTVLLVEDERALRTMTQKILQRAGYTVLPAANGVEALEILAHAGTPLHLVLTDVVMPHMGGRELAERVAELRPDARLLFMSGYTDDDMIQRGVIADGRQFLAKPYSPAQLLERVARMMPEGESTS